MNANFKAKFLQNLVSKKKGNEGFTLIELLVVIIIVGVLAAIALPSFLNQIGKARGSEAKSSLGTINRSQQAYRLENNTFAGALTNLDAKISGNFYGYSLGAATTTQATALTTSNQAGLKISSSMVNQSGDTFTQIICESTNTQNNTTTAAAPTNVTTCAANYARIQ
jgi:type IV pilus assembly protein PilA